MDVDAEATVQSYPRHSPEKPTQLVTATSGYDNGNGECYICQ